MNYSKRAARSVDKSTLPIVSGPCPFAINKNLISENRFIYKVNGDYLRTSGKTMFLTYELFASDFMEKDDDDLTRERATYK